MGKFRTIVRRELDRGPPEPAPRSAYVSFPPEIYGARPCREEDKASIEMPARRKKAPGRRCKITPLFTGDVSSQGVQGLLFIVTVLKALDASQITVSQILKKNNYFSVISEVVYL